jgi:RNA polymerase sigma-70 factor, ECF subfamily
MNQRDTGAQAGNSKPCITLTALDHERLSGLARAAMTTMPDVASSLADELERAHVLPMDRQLENIVCMGCGVQFRDEMTGCLKRVTLVYPSEADIALSKISVLTPIGTALIGLGVGKSITWKTRTGAVKRLTVIQVHHASRSPGKSSSDQAQSSESVSSVPTDSQIVKQSTRPAPLPPSSEATDPDDALLVDRIRSGDSGAFELIMRRYNRRLYRLARGILRNGPESDDVVQEAYVRANEKLDGFIGPSGFSAWLGKIVVNEALGRLRKRGRVILLDDHVKGRDGDANVRSIETMETQQPDPERLAASSELRRLLEDAIDTLPHDYRAVFVLRALEGMTISETAQWLSIRPETVKTRFHRARRLLQSALGEYSNTSMRSAFTFAGQDCDRIVATVLTWLGPSFEAAQHANGLQASNDSGNMCRSKPAPKILPN